MVILKATSFLEEYKSDKIVTYSINNPIILQPNYQTFLHNQN
jgi:hypothetical protein